MANIVGSNAGQVSNIYGYAANRNTNVTNVNGGTVRNSYIIKGKMEHCKTVTMPRSWTAMILR